MERALAVGVDQRLGDLNANAGNAPPIAPYRLPGFPIDRILAEYYDAPSDEGGSNRARPDFTWKKWSLLCNDLFRA
jgi:hypothetical protein